jgi:hypothetical protein
MLTACADLKEELVRRGLNPDESPPEVLSHLFETTAAGAHIIDIGRVLSEVELRAPSGTPMVVSSMGFMDLTELASLSRRLGCNEKVKFEEVPCEVAEFIVSVTLRELTPNRTRNTLLQ